MIDQALYASCPQYRQLADELFRVQQELGAMVSAYKNAISDQSRLRDHVVSIIDHLHDVVRDDPGKGGSGGNRSNA